MPKGAAACRRRGRLPWWSMILSEKPVPIPDRVEDMLFGIMLWPAPEPLHSE